MAKGGVIGSNWTISGNGANGVSFVEFHPVLSICSARKMVVVEVCLRFKQLLSFVHTSGNEYILRISRTILPRVN